MELRKKAGELRLLHKKWFLAVIFVECCLILLGVSGLFGKNKSYDYDVENLYINEALVGEENTIHYLDVVLPKGVYQVSVLYDTDVDFVHMCTVETNSVGKRSLLCGGEHFYSQLDRTDFQMWVLEDDLEIAVNAVYGGSGEFTLEGLHISETNALSRIYLFVLILFILLINGLIIFVQYDKAYHIPVQNKVIYLGLMIIMILASIPLLSDSMVGGGDLIYHLMRIEGIKDGLLSGQFPVRIAPKWQQGYGYASSVFYGETLLYIAAFFRLIGFSVTTSYRLFMFLITIATVLVSYHCFQRIFANAKIGLFCSAIYSLSVYRLSKTFVKEAFGETLAILFLPVIVYGFYKVFSEDSASGQYKKAWIPLTIGFTGLVQSHFLTGELVGFFTILLCVLCIRKVLVKNTFIVLTKTVIYTFLLSAWFLVPFVDYMLRDDFVIKNVSGRTIQESGLELYEMLYLHLFRGNWDQGIGQCVGLGLIFVVLLIAWIVIALCRKTKCFTKKEIVLGSICSVFGCLAAVMSLKVFPWDSIQFISPVTATLISSIQFPYRFLTIATVLLTVVGGLVLKWILENWNIKGIVASLVVTGILMLVCSGYLIYHIESHLTNLRVYNGECMGTGYVGGGEYLPYGTDTSLLVHRAPIVEDNIILDGYEKNGLTMKINCHNSSDREGSVDLPLLYYRGYRAYDMETGQEIPVCKGSNCVVALAVPAGYEGTIKVEFSSTWYWHCAELVSVFVFAVLMIKGLRKKTIR